MNKKTKKLKFDKDNPFEEVLWSMTYSAWRASVPAPMAHVSGLDQAAAEVADRAVLQLRERQ